MEIIGLSGYARSGKDEAAKVLIEEFGFERVAFADKLREVLYALNPYVEGGYDKRFGGTEYRLVQDVIDTFTWDGYKESPYGPGVRRLLQRLGTEAGRQTLWDTIWIDASLTGFADTAKVVVTDCRFENEAAAVTAKGGQVWRIMRAGVGPTLSADGSAHASETSLDDWDFDCWIHNDGSLEDFRESVKRRYLERVGKK